jgi:hypothetical protein
MDEYGSAAVERPGCVTAYAILTLLGPQIGEVFSNIVDELGTPMP